jgi:serine/threonine protein kinase
MNPASWEQAKDVITEALRHAPAEREQFVRARCADKTLADEIITLINAYREDGDFLADSQTLAAGGRDDEELEPGTRIGPYVIIDSIGRGGMGHVFLGSDPRLRRKVALKCVIRSLAGSGERRLRILHEARAAASVTHPNVATIHDVVEHGDRAFMVMEYVEGESLAARMKRERLPIDRVIAIGRQLASALAAAHARHVVHRDLKPGNVHFAIDGTVKVLDFGIANVPRVTATAATNSPTMATAIQATARGPQPGTPPYMSPEQLMGGRVDERSDIYSLGVVLFEMATGRRPYLETDAINLVVAIANGAPRADKVEPAVPRALADVIANALAVDVEARYQSAAGVGAALERVEARVNERQKGIGELIRRWATRVAVGMLMAPPALVSLGFLSSLAFNNTFGRTGPFSSFAHETASDYLYWGGRSAVGPVLYIILGTVAYASVKFTARVAMLVPKIGAALRRQRERLRTFGRRLELDDPVVLAQALATLGIVVTALLFWVFRDLIRAVAGFINSSPAEWFLALHPDNPARGYYRIALTLVTLAFALGLYRVITLRRARRARDGVGSLLLLAAIVAFLVMMADVPYRLFSYSECERVDLGNLRCYAIGESGDDVLVYCPGSPPPRNRVVKRTDPSLHRLGIVESVFTPQPGTRAGF